MTITDFTRDHVPQAEALARTCYEEERGHTPALPPVDALPPLDRFAQYGFGAAAFDGETLLGFLCFYPPIARAFTTRVRGTFSPIHAHGAVADRRADIYARLYAYAACKLVGAGIPSHSIALYAHDTAAKDAFFTYGFGLRCIDAVRPMKPLACAPIAGYPMRALAESETHILLPLKNLLITHLGESPSFMRYAPMTAAQLDDEHARRGSRYFCAFSGGEAVAFVEVADAGENFACDDASMQNICGAYCLTAHRGNGLFANLVNFAVNSLAREGYTRLGVDFESFNPTANGFWCKHFSVYTHSVVRRIDDLNFDA